MLRDGMHQHAVHTGQAPYRPNSIDGGEPLVAGTDDGGYVPTPRRVEGSVERAQPDSFYDHFTQPAMFYRSLSDIEKIHLVEAFTFELGKCYEQAIKERQLQVLADVDADLCAQVAAGLGLSAPQGNPPKDVTISPALSQVYAEPGPVTGRKVGILADANSDLAGVGKLIKTLLEHDVVPLLTAPVGGKLKSGRRTEIVERSLLTARSIEYDAVIVAAGTAPGDFRQTSLLQEVFRHCKPIAAWGDGRVVVEESGVGADSPGVQFGKSVDKGFVSEFIATLGLHRAWDRALAAHDSIAPR
jgi:catalase